MLNTGHHKNLDTIGKQNYQEPGELNLSSSSYHVVFILVVSFSGFLIFLLTASTVLFYFIVS